MGQERLLYGIDNKKKRIKKFCEEFLNNDSEFRIMKEKLSLTPTFLFHGLPGSGKTTIANWIYEELKEKHNIDKKYLRIDELISHNFGESSKNLREFFNEVKREIDENDSYAFVIIDEIDSFTINRYQNDNESVKRILLTFNTIIDELVMDGNIFRIILIATSNLKESIDTSILRRLFFHEDFNIDLNKEDFYEFIENLKSSTNVFNSIDDNFKEQLFKIYREKRFTLGEFKTIFSYFYMEHKTKENNEKLSIQVFKERESFYEIVKKQQKGGL